jgi:phospholipase C
VSLEEARARNLNRYGFDFGWYGPRVPAVVVSPLIPKGTVDHTVYDHSSIIRTLGRWLDLPPLTCRDEQANDLLPLLTGPGRPDEDCPRTLVEPARPAPLADILADGTDTAVPDARLPDSGNTIGFLRVLLKAELELAGSDGALKQRITEEFAKISSTGQARDYVERMWHKIAGAPGPGS